MVLGIITLYCGLSGQPGFYNNQSIGLAKSMVKLGYSVCIIDLQKNISTLKEEIIKPNITHYSIPAHSIGVHGYFQWSKLDSIHLDIVQIDSDNQIFSPYLVRYFEKRDIPVYNYIGTLTSDSGSFLHRSVIHFLSKSQLKNLSKHKCFAKTPSVLSALNRIHAKDPELASVGLDLSIIPSELPSPAETRIEYNLPEGKTIIMYVGRIDPYKQPLLLIKLATLLPEKYHFLVVGTGSLDGQFESAICTSKLSTRFTWIKKIPNDKIHALYLASDYFINLNQQEIFGMSLLEGMYHGLTTIALHAPGPDYIIENNITGFLVDDIESIAACIQQNECLDPAKIRRHVLSHFTWDSTAKIISKWITEMAK